MFGAKAYAQVGLESGVNSASPHGLILMLYDGAIGAIRQAIISQENNDIAAKGMSITKALRIINEGLRAAVDENAGGELAQKLLSLYDYMGRELLQANSRNDVEKMSRCIALLEDLRSGWSNIGQGNSTNAVYQA